MTALTPKILFAAVSLQSGSGGIAELSRQVFKVLLDLHRRRLIKLQVHVLEGRALEAGDDLLDDEQLPEVRWYAGNRWWFALRLVSSGSDFLLLDHVGLGRLPGLLPSPLVRNYLVLIHGVEIWAGDRADYLRTARKAGMLIANSEYTARRVRDTFSDFPEIRVCWPGKDRSHPGGNAMELTHGNIGSHAMLIVGRLSAKQGHKGHDHLIEALQLILWAVPDAQLVIAGEGDDRPRLEAKVTRLGLANHVVFTGWVDGVELRQLYSRCALFVMPSTGDGFGIVFLEAMMHRLPCVGLKTGAAAEIFEDEVSGILIDREDLPGMASRLSALLLDPQRRKCLGEAGFARYQSAFQHRHYAERLQSIFAEHFQLEQKKSRAIAARVV